MTLVKADPENFEEVGVFEVPGSGIAQARASCHRDGNFTYARVTPLAIRSNKLLDS